MMTSDRLGGYLRLVESSLEDRQVTGGELARRAHLSRFHFDRMVAASLGEPPAAFRRRILLERAAYMLMTSTGAVIDIAVEADFGSPEAFTRAFTRAFGMNPSRFRSAGGRDFRVTSPSGIHFHPPGGLQLPATSRSTSMDILASMLDHHLALVADIIDRSSTLDARVLDQRITISVESIDAEPTLRSTMVRLVGQLERWVTSLEGGTEWPRSTATSPTELRARLDVVAPRFRRLVLTPIEAGHGDDAFIDATCEPPRTFTYAGVLAHVLTFAAFRRTLAIGALDSAGIHDLGSGDPMQYVGGIGADASEITRN
jgi:AraC family transcriptional regulator